MKNVLWVMTLVLVVLMPTQWAVHVGGQDRPVTREVGGVTRTDIKHEGGAWVTPGDVWLVVVFLVWAAYVAVTFRFFEVRLPALAAFVFVAVVAASALRSSARGGGLREFMQLGAYFIGGWLVFANCMGTRGRLKAAVGLFTVVVGVVVLIALYQYRTRLDGNVFKVCGTFENRNVLGAFFAVTLPFVFALALYEERIWQRFALMLTVAFGAMVTLSGGALIALGVGLLFVAAVKSRLALAGTVLAVLLAVTVVPGALPLSRHSDVAVSSVNPYVSNNYLDWRQGEAAVREEPEVAVRYKCWYASTKLIRRTLRWPFLGVGPGRFNQAVEGEYGSVEKPKGATDDVRAFNVHATEPDSFNMYLVTCAEVGPVGLVALLWLGAFLLGRNVLSFGRCRDKFGRALAVGSAGAVISGAVCGVFTSILVRGVAVPFLFVAVSGIVWSTLRPSPGQDAER